MAARLGRTDSADVLAAPTESADCSLMTYEEIEFVIRAGLGRNEWVLLISFPDNVEGNPSIVNFGGSRKDALAQAKKRIDNWVKRLKKKKSKRCSGAPSKSNGS
jgi:hypothetical protein